MNYFYNKIKNLSDKPWKGLKEKNQGKNKNKTAPYCLQKKHVTADSERL